MQKTRYPSPKFYKCAWAQTLRDQNVPGNNMYTENTFIIALTKKAIPSVYFQPSNDFHWLLNKSINRLSYDKVFNVSFFLIRFSSL